MAEAKAAASSQSGFNFKQAISQMVQRNASDLLLKVGRPPTVRVNGELNALEMPPVKPEDLKLLAEQIMTPRQVKEFAEHKEYAPGDELRHLDWKAFGKFDLLQAGLLAQPCKRSPLRCGDAER